MVRNVSVLLPLPRLHASLKPLCSELWRPMFCSVYLMYTTDVEAVNGSIYQLASHGAVWRHFAFRKPKMEWAVVINFKPTMNWNRLCQASIRAFSKSLRLVVCYPGIPLLACQRGLSIRVSSWVKYAVLTMCWTCKPLQHSESVGQNFRHAQLCCLSHEASSMYVL